MRLRSFLCFLLFFNCVYNAFSQTTNYSPFPKIYGKWCLRGEHYVNNNMILDWTLYETAGDTTIGSFVYKKINSTPTCYACTPGPPTYDGWSVPYGPKKLAFAYRNDIPNKKVYILTDTNKAITGRLAQEYLWYDFDLKEGDTLKSTYALDLKKEFDYSRIIVKSFASNMFLCGNPQRRFSFVCQTSSALVEGMGFSDNFIVTAGYCPFEPPYIYNTYFSCTKTSISEAVTAKSISLFPNPVSNSLKIEWSQQNVLPTRYSIVDCFGKVVMSNASVHEVIDVTALPKGIYFIIINDNLGNCYKSKFIKQD